MADNLRTREHAARGRAAPDDDELETINSWLDTALSADRQHGARRVAIRRLNRAEYNNTIRDLIGLDLHPADEFPSDDVGYGFDNIGEVLSTPPVLLEMYLAAAEEGDRSGIPSRTRARERLMNPPRDTVPRAFRQYTPPVRSPRADKTLRNVPGRSRPRTGTDNNTFTIFCSRFATAPSAGPRPTTKSRACSASYCQPRRTASPPSTALQLAFRAVLVSPHFLFLQNKTDHDQRFDKRFCSDQ